MAAKYKTVFFRTKPTCEHVKAWCEAYESELIRIGELRQSLDVFQLVGGAPQSGGTHVTPGAIDTAQTSTKQLRVARQMGAAAWKRTEAQGFEIDHAHLVINCPCNGASLYQWVACNADFSGLGAGGRASRDNGPRSGIRFPLRSWKQGIAWAKKRARVRTSVLLINCASGRNDKAVDGTWVDRRPILKRVILKSEASFIITSELYTAQRGWISEEISPKYKLAAGFKGRNIYLRRGRWSRDGNRWFWKGLRGVTRKPAVGIRARHVASGRRLGVTGLQLSYKPVDEVKNRKSEVKKMLRWGAVRFKGMGKLYAGDYNTPAGGTTRPDDVIEIMRGAGFHDLGLQVHAKTGRGRYHLDRAFGSPSLEGESVQVIDHDGSDHPAVIITFRF